MDLQHVPTVEIVDKLLAWAVENEATDLYLIPGRDLVDVQVRILGTQRPLTQLPAAAGLLCITRLKVLAQLLTYKTTVSQDGAISQHPAFPDREFRVSTMPTQHGERLAVRLLNLAAGPMHLEDIGFQETQIETLRTMLQQEHGMIILTGPTGSGKTTTIYAMIRELIRMNLDPASIITIEDPIEAPIPGISQTAIRPNEGWDYPSALKAALRQDVKTLVVGEMRDAEVVKVTLDAAMTGHRIITTYHAGDIPSVYARLMHLGFEPFIIAAAITGVISQRLVCDNEKRHAAADMLIPDDGWKDFLLTKPSLKDLKAMAAKS